MNIKNLFSTIKLSKWVPYFKPKGERLLDAMYANKLRPQDFYAFYKTHGDIQLEFVEKIINERVKEDSFSHLTNVQCAYLGLHALQSLQKQIIIEMYADEQLAIHRNKVLK